MKAKLILLLFSFGFFIAVAEVILRVSPSLEMMLSPQSSGLVTVSHPVYGWKSAPSRSYWFTQEGRSQGRINAAGWRDQDYSIEKPADVIRILVIGDSMVESLQVNLEQTFHKLLEKHLNQACKRKRYEVIALGKSGYGTGQELLVYQNEGRLYNPDLVILMFTMANDFVDNSKRLATRNGRLPLSDNGARKPYFSLKDAQLILDNSFKINPSYTTRLDVPRRKLIIPGILKNAWINVRRQRVSRSSMHRNASGIYTQDVAEIDPADIGEDTQIFRSPILPVWKEEIPLTLALVQKLSQEVQKDRHAFLVVSVPSDLNVHAERMRTLRRRFQEELSVQVDPQQPERLFNEFTGSRNISHLSLLSSLEGYTLQTGRSPFGFGVLCGHGHFNVPGHKIVADALFDEIMKQRPHLCETKSLH